LGANHSAIHDETGATLVVDLDAVAENYDTLRQKSHGAETGATVKADAYGLGLEQVARTLSASECRTFFVATAAEGLALRHILPAAEIIVLNGPSRESVKLILDASLSPVLNSLHQIDLWRHSGGAGDKAAAAYLHFDTGMNRLGLGADEAETLFADPSRLHDISISSVMSHLACADTPDNPMNAAQLTAFRDLRSRLEGVIGPVRASLANTPGVFLGPDYHFDLVRPGAALFGLAPQIGARNPMRQTIEIYAKILQVRSVDTHMTVGYGAAQRVERPSRIATVGAGYAEGYPRAAVSRIGETMHAFIAGHRVPLFGRVSMDLITLDVSDIPEALAIPGQEVELLGPHVTPDSLAASAGTIGYEVIARLGNRLHRVYRGGVSRR
jgi:alanine racemase